MQENPTMRTSALSETTEKVSFRIFRESAKIWTFIFRGSMQRAAETEA